MSDFRAFPSADAQQPATAPAGWYPDPGTGAPRYWDGWSWQPPAAPAPAWSTAPAWPSPPAFGDEAPADPLARGIATYERVSGALWILLGIVQLFSVVLIVAGVWNIVAGISRLAGAGRIERREARVPSMFQGVGGLVLIALVNLFFGAVLGVLLVAVDFYVRQRVLDNRHIFTR